MALLPNVSIGDPITPDHINDIRDTGVQVTTSSSRPISPFEGQVIYETNTDQFQVYSGGGWIPFGGIGTPLSWSPTVTQNTTRAGTTAYGEYQRIGNLVHAQLRWTSSGAGSANTLFITAPGGLSPRDVGSNASIVGRANIWHPSLAIDFHVNVIATTSGLAFIASGAGAFYATALQAGTLIIANLDFFT